MTTNEFLHRYWRVPVVALLGGLIAFAGSFLIQETYASSTRLLIRSQDTTFFTTTGQPVSDQKGGTVDLNTSKSLAETYAGTATSREVATMVVDQLNLDDPKPKETGPVAWAANAAATTYKCGRAFITFGYCADPDPREEAIQNVQSGLMAAQLGPESGAAAGQANSYIVELVGSGETAQEARDVTNAAADATIQTSLNRSRVDAQSYADSLGTQVAAASDAVGAAATEVSNFQVEHGITDLDQQKVAAVSSATDTRNQLATSQDQLAGAQAELASINATLAGIDPQSTTNEQMTTGRSNTSRASEGPNALYNEVSSQQATAAAKVEQLKAEVASLQARLGDGSPDGAALTEDQAQLLQLDQALSLAQSNLGTLTTQHQQALVNVDAAAIELTRIDEASTPTYPVAPKKYLYLALGILLGGLAGGGLTWLARRRELGDEDGADDPSTAGLTVDDGFDVDLRTEVVASQLPERVPVGAATTSAPSLFSRPAPDAPSPGAGNGNGNGNGNGHGNGNGNGNGHGNGDGGGVDHVIRSEGDVERS